MTRPSVNRETAYDYHRKSRHKMIMDFLRDRDATISEISLELKIPYSTVHREVNHLIRTFQIYATGHARGKSPLYKCGSPDTAPPEVVLIDTGRPIELIDMVTKHVTSEPNGIATQLRYSVSAQDVTRTILRYLLLAARVANGTTDYKDELNDIRSKLVKDRDVLLVCVSIYEQMIENQKRWTHDELVRVGKLAKHDYESIDKLVKLTNPNDEKQYD